MKIPMKHNIDYKTSVTFLLSQYYRNNPPFIKITNSDVSFDDENLLNEMLLNNSYSAPITTRKI